ncbi:RICIN domain-containing protein [Kitasatospora cinereorecta]
MGERSVRGGVFVVIGVVLATGFLAGPSASADSERPSHHTVVSTGALGHGSRPGGKVTRDQVIERAQAWVDQAVPYSANGLSAPFSWWSDSATGGHYRQDCSGYVSMAWQLESSLSTHSLSSVATTVRTTDLERGDVLNSAQHALIFGGWTDKGRGTFTYYQQSSRSRPTNKSEGSIYASRLAGHPTSSYTGLRYKNITDTAPAAPVKGTPPASSDPAPKAPPVPSAPSRQSAPTTARQETRSSGATAKPARRNPPAAAPSAPAPPAAPAASKRTKTWVSSVSGKCLEIRRDTTDNGDLANQWDCNGSATQRWTSTDPGRTGSLVNANSGLCLEVRGDALHDGANANQWECNGSATQIWRQKAVPGGFVLLNTNSGKCLEIADPASGDGALASQRTCNGSAAQTWL